MARWRSDVPTDGAVDLPPDPRSMEALGRNHSLETALADLVDNSVDAEASRVLIRFIQRGPRLLALYVVDDGRGMAPDRIDEAMKIGGRRRYGRTDLGAFGLGLKAASFSQAASLTVLSRAAGRTAIGRQWQMTPGRVGFACDIVPGDFAEAELSREWPFALTASGTVVRWDSVHGFPISVEAAQIDAYLHRTINHLRGHLGLMFHRILTARRIRIGIDIEDLDHGVGVHTEITPLDPFGYPEPPRGWPRDLTADVDGCQLLLRCHLWPRRSNVAEYRLPDGAERRQGLYFYRRDRLLQGGGWEGVHAADPRLQLARVAVDLDDLPDGLFVMNSEKSRVQAGPRLASLLSSARAADGTTMADYLKAAEELWVASNRRPRGRRDPVIPAGKGLHADIRQQVLVELPHLKEEPVNILWKRLPGEVFFDIDRDSRTVWLNSAYRRALLGGRDGSLNDAPVVKSLMYLLTENLFHGSHLGSRDKDNIEVWQEILTAAAKAEPPHRRSWS